VEAKQKEIEQKLAQAKADAHGAKNDQIEKWESKLNELRDTLKDGWDNLSEQAAARLNDWMQ
jgi:hypothetical protein